MEILSRSVRYRTLRRTASLLVILWAVAMPVSAIGGPYPPAAGQPGSTAVPKDSPAFASWATGWEHYLPGEALDERWKTPEEAIGPAEGSPFDVVVLGRGGEITLTFDPPISVGDGWDFAVFENSFSDTFLELGYVEVSSGGIHFLRFDNDSMTPNPVPAYGTLDPTDVDGFAGKYRQGYGTPFDLRDLAEKDEVISGLVDLSGITHVRIVDVVGDGSCFDTSENVIFDPYPTVGSAGFDLDAIGVRHQYTGSVHPPDQPALSFAEDYPEGVPLTPKLQTSPFSDPDEGDIHLLTRWQIKEGTDFVSEETDESELVFDLTSSSCLTSLTVSWSVLADGVTYFCRVRFYDGGATQSEWSESFFFTTTAQSGDTDGDGIPDDQQLEPDSTVDLNGDGIRDVLQISDTFKVLNTFDESGQMGIEVSGVTLDSIESIDPDDIADAEGKPDDMPLGLLSFRLRGVPIGGVIDITVYLSEPAPSNGRWFRYDLMNGWHDHAASDPARILFGPGRMSLTLRLKDGDYGDADGVENGVISDPGGVGTRTSSGAADPGSLPPSGEAGFGGGGCFIATAAHHGTRPLGDAQKEEKWNSQMSRKSKRCL